MTAEGSIVMPLAALTLSNGDLSRLEVEILDA
jgi:hypothetical protein